MRRRRKLTFIDKVRNVLAIQGLIFVTIKILTYIESVPAIKQYAFRLMCKGWLSQWNFEWLI